MNSTASGTTPYRPTNNLLEALIYPQALSIGVFLWCVGLSVYLVVVDSRRRTASLAEAVSSFGALLAVPPPSPEEEPPPQRWQDRLRDLTGVDVEVCPSCGGRMVTCGILKPQPPPRPPMWCDSS